MPIQISIDKITITIMKKKLGGRAVDRPMRLFEALELLQTNGSKSLSVASVRAYGFALFLLKIF